MEQKRQEALRLYLTQNKTQREIAELIGVSDRTIYSWIRKYAWDKLRYASYQAPAMIAEKLCNQLVELQNAIDRREPGCRYPTKDESQIIHRLILDIEKMRKFPSMGVTMQVLQTFMNHVRKCDKDLAFKLNMHLLIYTEQKAAAAGPYPLSFECDPEKVSPILPMYHEETDYTRFYEYRVPEPEESEAEPDLAIENQTIESAPAPLEPAETGSKSEDDLDEIKKILQQEVTTMLPRKETKEKREQYLERWRNFVKKINNDPPNGSQST